MCVSPVTLRNGQQVGCRQCWQCRYQRIDDLVGRCIAESVTSHRTDVVTLTYGRDGDGHTMHTRAAQLVYRDIELLMKRLRKQGFPPRYMVAGELGTKNKRSHWHCVFMWPQSAPINPPLEKRLDWEWVDRDGVIHKWWDHGFTYFEKPAFEKLRYNLKYALKDTKDPEAESRLGYSRFPPLGHLWFQARARNLAEQRLVPLDGLYEFADVRKPNGELRKFAMRLKTLDNFMYEYVSHWRTLYGDEKFPPSSFFEEWQDKQERVNFDFDEFGTRKSKEKRRWKVGGYVSSFQPNEGGGKQWLNAPREVQPAIAEPFEIEWKDRRSDETYAQFRMRQLGRVSVKKRPSSSEDRKR